MTKYTVTCYEKVYYEVEVEATDEGEAIDKVKDNLPSYEDFIDSEFEDFDIKYP